MRSSARFRVAIIGYAEWGSRLALHISEPKADGIVAEAPVPRRVGA